MVGAMGKLMQCGTLELRPWRFGGGIRAPQARWAHRGVRRLPRGRPVQRCSVVAFRGLNAAGRPAGWRGGGGHGHRLWKAHIVLGRVLLCHRPVCIVRRRCPCSVTILRWAVTMVVRVRQHAPNQTVRIVRGHELP